MPGGMCNAQISPVSNRPYRDRFSVSIAESGRLGPRSVRGEESCSHIRALAAQDVGSRDVVACCRVLQSRIENRAGARRGSARRGSDGRRAAQPKPERRTGHSESLSVNLGPRGANRDGWETQASRPSYPQPRSSGPTRSRRFRLEDPQRSPRCAAELSRWGSQPRVVALRRGGSTRTGEAAGDKDTGWINTQTGNRLGADRAFEDTPGNQYRRRSSERNSRCTGGRYRDSSGRVTGL